jgi:hypothetical protein
MDDSNVTYIDMLMFDKNAQPEDWGIILTMLDSEDLRPAKVQLDEGYQHGGGWRPQEGFKFDDKTGWMSYPGDPPFKPLSGIRLRDELIVLYPYGYVGIIQPDSSFEIARMD